MVAKETELQVIPNQWWVFYKFFSPIFPSLDSNAAWNLDHALDECEASSSSGSRSHMAPILRMANKLYGVSFCCCCLVTMVCQTLCNSMDCSMPDFPVPHHLPVCPSSCPLNWWCHPTVSSSVTLFSFCLQPFPASGSFPMSQMFASGSQNIGASALESVLPMCIYGWFPFKICWFDLRVVQGTLKSLL